MTIRKKRIKRKKNKKKQKHSNNRYAICDHGAGNVSRCYSCLRKSGKTRFQQQNRDNKGNLWKYYQLSDGSNWH